MTEYDKYDKSLARDNILCFIHRKYKGKKLGDEDKIRGVVGDFPRQSFFGVGFLVFLGHF